ncbi:MAG: leucine-rich repeat domain-containing protein [Silicimonas sp.]|nr:leucine-rich repeat domain-containing protein [Silicimonas sp.]
MRRLLVALAIFVLILGAGVIWTANPGTDEAYAAAESRIDAAIAEEARILRLSDLSNLGHLPPRIAEMTDLIQLDLRGTLVSDVSVLSGLQNLRILNLHGTLLRNVDPLAGLPALDTLDVGETWISDIAPLTKMPELRRLDIGTTQIKSLEPATRMERLNWINLHGAHALDGSQTAYQALIDKGLTVNNGRAFRQDYRPGFLQRLRIRVERIVHRARLGLGANR